MVDLNVGGRSVSTENPLVLLTGIVGAVMALHLFWMLLIEDTVQFNRLGTLLWDGLMRGLLIGLAGIGLSMTYSILNFANFAHGDYITSGAFAGWGVTYLIAGLGTADWGDLLLVGAAGGVYGPQLGIGITQSPIAIVIGLVLAAVAAVAISLLVDRIVYRSMRDVGGIPLLIASVGVAFALRYLVAFVYTQSNRGTTSANQVPSWSIYVLDGTVSIDAHDVTLLVAAVALMAAVHLLLQGTKLGKAMRAMADNKDLALVTGIPAERVIRWTWIIGGALTGAAGYLVVLWRGTLTFQFGWLLLLLIFAAVILGGIGSVYGAIFGGIVIGLTMSLSQLWIPTDFARAAAFAIMILILLVRPEGIFGGRTTA
jgi:branched-chain amino acid transport system permease protein